MEVEEDSYRNALKKTDELILLFTSQTLTITRGFLRFRSQMNCIRIRNIRTKHGDNKNERVGDNENGTPEQSEVSSDSL